ncbi:hypothetical protein EG329_008258 [Mollisiaceae sp. DMI_Dod_QoI]|nr:hypothetical protein EG329_008258 [Helotiales sp. DMI_Dod_QoI]
MATTEIINTAIEPPAIETTGPIRGWPGRVQDGQLYCDCEPGGMARCRTIKQRTKDCGRKIWLCYNEDKKKQCYFRIFDDDAAKAKEWLAQYGPPPLAPETPVSKGKEPEYARSRENPWTKSIPKSKRKLVSTSTDVSEESENGGPSERKSNRNSDEEEAEEIGDPDSPSRRPAKRARFDTPGQISLGGLKNAAEAFPTPNTGKQPEIEAVASGSRTSKELTLASARLGEIIDLTEEEPSSLTTAVLDELRSENVVLKESTSIQISHLIDMEMDINERKVQRYKMTIKKLCKRLDALGDAIDDAVELSD